jgi:hypothetical protein
MSFHNPETSGSSRLAPIGRTARIYRQWCQAADPWSKIPE